jgi:hypothetical protein
MVISAPSALVQVNVSSIALTLRQKQVPAMAGTARDDRIGAVDGQL